MRQQTRRESAQAPDILTYSYRNASGRMVEEEEEEEGDQWEEAPRRGSGILPDERRIARASYRPEAPVRPQRRTSDFHRQTTSRLPANPTRQLAPGNGQRVVSLGLIVLGLTLLLGILGVFLVEAVGSWWTTHQDDTTYGRPRTFQADHYVQQADDPSHPAHFVALNLGHGTIVVLELFVLHPEKNRTMQIHSTGSDLDPVRLDFPTGQNGLPDLAVFVGDGSPSPYILTNKNGQFVPQVP